MVDKLEVRVPRGAEFSKEFASVYGDLAHSKMFYKHFRQSQHYAQVGDLRPFGFSSVLHFSNKHGKDGNHKLELIDSGKMGYSHMVNEIERVFSVNPEGLDVMRIDAAADVPDISVDWFYRRAHACYKQFADQIGKMEMQTMGKREIQTLYFGKRPNCIRIYNKTAELQNEYAKLMHHNNEKSIIPEFKEIFGCEPTAIKTRVERQMAGGRVPHKLALVGTLKLHGREFNPFEKLHFINFSQLRAEPNVSDYPLITYAAGMYLRQLAEERGMPWLRAWVSHHWPRKAHKTLTKLRDFLPSQNEGEPGISEKELFERYLDSFSQQMAA